MSVGSPSQAASLPRSRILAWSPAVFVWGVWVVMALFALFCIARYASNVPIAEDWLIVPVLTGNEANFAGWLWAQNNEHRVPLPRLLLLALVTLAGGDFRAGMVFDVLALAALALAMILVAKELRGRLAYADAFFPVALLHMGHWENLVWSWQIQFVSSMVITGILLLIIVRWGDRLSLPLAVLAGLLVILLPLVGASGLVFVPSMALWFGYTGLRQWQGQKKTAGLFLIAASLVACVLLVAYFIGYERPAWVPPNPGMTESLKTAMKFLALGFGPAAKALWPFYALAALSFLLASAAVLVAGLWRSHRGERQRALALLLFFGTFGVLALATGWGRAGLVPTYGMPARYALLAAMGFCCAYFIWQLYGPAAWTRAVQAGLFLSMLLLIPANVAEGFTWRDWYLQGVNAVKRDIDTGMPASLLAERHQGFLLPGNRQDVDQPLLEANLRLLKDEGIEPFAQMSDEASVEEVVVSGPLAAEEGQSLMVSLAPQPVLAVRLAYGGETAEAPSLSCSGPDQEMHNAERTLAALGQYSAVTFWIGGVLESLEILQSGESAHIEGITLLVAKGN